MRQLLSHTSMEKERLDFHFDERILTPQADEIVRPVHTLPLHEARLLSYCKERGIVCYLPLRKQLRRLHRTYRNRQYDYTEEVLVPMFRSYLFACMTTPQREELFRSKSITAILQVHDQEHLLDELRVVRKIEEIAQKEELEFNCEIKEGDKFLIESGPWQGVYGYLSRKEKRCQWIVEIESIGGLVQATIDPALYKMSKA